MLSSVPQMSCSHTALAFNWRGPMCLLKPIGTVAAIDLLGWEAWATL